jgi:hypothetical protein
MKSLKRVESLLSVLVVMILLGLVGCASQPNPGGIPADWWENPPLPTATSLYFVGVSPQGTPPDVARNAAEVDGRSKLVQYFGTEVETNSHVSMTNAGTSFKAQVDQKANGLVRNLLPIRYHTNGVTYVLMVVERYLVNNAISELEKVAR